MNHIYKEEVKEVLIQSSQVWKSEQYDLLLRYVNLTPGSLLAHMEHTGMWEE